MIYYSEFLAARVVALRTNGPRLSAQEILFLPSFLISSSTKTNSGGKEKEGNVAERGTQTETETETGTNCQQRAGLIFCKRQRILEIIGRKD